MFISSGQDLRISTKLGKIIGIIKQIKIIWKKAETIFYLGMIILWK